MAFKIRSNDEVIVISGKNKGKKGKVRNILPNGKIIINNINLIKKHQKPIPSIKNPGGIIEKEAAIDISNVAILNTDTNKPDRIGFKIKNGKKIRIFKSSKKEIK